LTVRPDEGGKKMVKRKNETPSSRIEKSNENENNSRLLSASTSNSNEDLIVSLSDAYENKRARQVVEWEKLGKQKLQQNQQRAT
jgi:hypothetical protein